VTRKKDGHVAIEHFSVGIVGAIQPSKIAMAIGASGDDTDGLGARFLWSWSGTARKFKIHLAETNDTAADAAFVRLARLQMTVDERGILHPIKIRVAEAGVRALEEFGNEMANASNEAEGIMAQTLMKAPGHALRLSLILTYLDWCAESRKGEPSAISEDAMMRAIGLVDGYFLPHARKVLGELGRRSSERLSKRLLDELKKRGLSTFNARELRLSLGGELHRAACMNQACADLTEAGWLRPATAAPAAKGGRPAKNYEVNPALYEERRPNEQVA
jgi:hypothetical protein